MHGTNPKNQYCHKTSNKKGIFVKARTVSSNACAYSESTNWKLDYYKFKGFTFADVVKSKTHQCHVQKDLGLSQKFTSAKPQTGTQAAIHAGKLVPQKTKIKANMKRMATNGIKVGQSKSINPVTCYNRYDVLQQDDAVVSQTSDTADVTMDLETSGYSNSTNIASNIHPDTTCKKMASFNDAPCKSRQNAAAKVPMQPQGNSETSVDPAMQNDSKYDLSLRLSDKKIDYTTLIDSCPTLKLWDKQNGFKFGFIPMGDLELPLEVVPSVSNCDPLTLHHMIKASQEYNFQKCQVTIKSQLNPDIWDELLQGYWDSQLPLLVRFGFPLDFDRITPLQKLICRRKRAMMLS